MVSGIEELGREAGVSLRESSVKPQFEALVSASDELKKGLASAKVVPDTDPADQVHLVCICTLSGCPLTGGNDARCIYMRVAVVSDADAGDVVTFSVVGGGGGDSGGGHLALLVLLFLLRLLLRLLLLSSLLLLLLPL